MYVQFRVLSAIGGTVVVVLAELIFSIQTPTPPTSGSDSDVWTAAAAIGAIVAAAVAIVALIYARISAKASVESAEAAKRATEHQITTSKQQNSAQLVFEDLDALTGTMETSLSERFFTMRFSLYNRGSHPAYDITLQTSLYDISPISEKKKVIQPNNSLEINIYANRQRIPSKVNGTYPLILSYLDGNGSHTKRYTYLLEGDLMRPKTILNESPLPD